MIEPGTKVICEHSEWCSAHGEEYTIAKGERLTVQRVYRLGGVSFFAFEEIGEDKGFWSVGFRECKATVH